MDCLLLFFCIPFATVLAVSAAKHGLLFREYIFRYITKKDIKFFAPLSFKKARRVAADKTLLTLIIH